MQKLLKKYSVKDLAIIGISCIIFILLGFEAVEYGLDVFAYLPLAVLGLILIFWKFYYSVFFVAFLTPLSIFIRNTNVSFTLPTEPMLVIIMLLFLWEYSFSKKYDRKLIKHPVTMWIIVSLLWIAFTSVFSSDILVSVKHLVARLFFVIPCYFLMLVVFKDYKKMLWFVAAYGFTLSAIIVSSSVQYALTGFDHDYADYIMQPFYNDHTAYGAAIGLFIPVCFYYLFASKQVYSSKWLRVLFAWICVWLVIGCVLSYARATWISVFAAACVFAVVKLNISPKLIGWGTALMILVLIFAWPSIVRKLSSNNQDSSGNISEHIQSMSNITTDASNTERLNRWACAFRMTKERPLVGWGFGTYQFVYGGFQHSSELTIISTNEGTLGNAHSEYIGPLCETGFIGCITIILIFATTIYYGLRVYHRAEDKNIANLALFITLSLITYYVHGIMNNFLDTDKLAVPFWAMTSMIVALDLYQPQMQKKTKEQSNKTK
ncbi:MAG: O-antigen ligase family protein [Bacteroidales bacterium]|nr:O-antigen ligase family protein [Bacteroidales bacterium]